jgi:hypothetical protein
MQYPNNRSVTEQIIDWESDVVNQRSFESFGRAVEEGHASGVSALAEATLLRKFTSRFALEQPDVVEFARGLLVGVELAG